MRVEDWQTQLQRYLDEARARVFAWGSNDCALWAARWVHLCTGVDHFSGWEGRYGTEKGALRAMLARGYFCVEDIADHHLKSKDIASAQRGDLVLDPNGCLGICNGQHSHFVTHGGLLMHRTLDCVKAWEVS